MQKPKPEAPDSRPRKPEPVENLETRELSLPDGLVLPEEVEEISVDTGELPSEEISGD